MKQLSTTLKNPLFSAGKAGTLGIVSLFLGILLLIPGKASACKSKFAYYQSDTFVSFTDSSAAANITWKFGDGTMATGYYAYHTYSPGTYTVWEIIDNGKGCKDSSSQTIIVKTCHAHFWYSISGTTLNFTNTSITTGTPSYYWDFGDGTTSTAQNPSHTFSSASAFANVICAISSSTGCSDTTKLRVQISYSCGFHAHFNYKVSGDSVTFTDSSYSTTSTGITSYMWYFDDSAAYTFGSKNRVHVYTGGGKYRVVLYVQDSSGNCGDMFTDTVVIAGTPSCGASLYYYTTGNTLTLSASPLSHGVIDSMRWDYGDGSAYAGGFYVNHTYPTAKNYTVKYISSNLSGCSHSDSFVVKLNSYSYFYGNVSLDSSGRGGADTGIVYLIYHDPTDSSLKLVDSFITLGNRATNDTSWFMFNAKQGNYLVKAALTKGSADYAYYLPTYYTSSLRWDSATTVSVPTTNFIKITMRKGSNPGGPGFIAGKVAAGANKKDDPLPGVNILLYNSAHIPVSYGVSDQSGNYTIKNLAYGTYMVYPEVFGKNTAPAYVMLNSSNPSVTNLHTYVGTTDVTTGILNDYALEHGIENASVYPNPVRDILNISLNNSSSSKSVLQVFDATGRLMFTGEEQLNIGKQNIQLTTDKLPVGIYLLRLNTTSGTNELQFRFIKGE